MFWLTKKVYFIRHGQSAQNLDNKRQGTTGKLSDKGRAQAEFVGKRFKDIVVDIILISPYERTIETAEIINSYLNVKTEICDLLVERKNPSEIIGKDADSEEVTKIMDVIDRSYHDNNFRYSDEENFLDLKDRAKKLLSFLANRPEKRIMCVSHRIFLKMVAAYIEFGENLTSEKFVKIDFLNKAENASVTFAEYSSWQARRKGEELKEQAGWKLLAWNDYSPIV